MTSILEKLYPLWSNSMHTYEVKTTNYYPNDRSDNQGGHNTLDIKNYWFDPFGIIDQGWRCGHCKRLPLSVDAVYGLICLKIVSAWCYFKRFTITLLIGCNLLLCVVLTSFNSRFQLLLIKYKNFNIVNWRSK